MDARVAGRRSSRSWAGLAARLRALRPAPPRPTGRPIQEIALDAQRLAAAFRYEPAGISFARVEGVRLAYDRVLGEACQTLGVEHLLGVLAPGTELDRERDRVEVALHHAGLTCH